MDRITLPCVPVDVGLCCSNGRGIFLKNTPAFIPTWPQVPPNTFDLFYHVHIYQGRFPVARVEAVEVTWTIAERSHQCPLFSVVMI